MIPALLAAAGCSGVEEAVKEQPAGEAIQASHRAPVEPKWILRELASSAIYRKYRFAAGSDCRELGYMLEKQAYVVFDNGSNERVYVQLRDNNEFEVAPAQCVVLETVTGRMEFQIRRVNFDGLETTEPFASHLEGNGTCYVYNHGGQRSYLIERKSYAITDSPIFSAGDWQYKVHNESWFRVRYGRVDFFFEPYPQSVTVPLGFASATKVRLSRL
ncbi:MAG TPA: hypothetical protein VMM76_14360 [Pirellulaceae bacterium]|nr:hypothetical protein [Pirellulaceae bacterium]